MSLAEEAARHVEAQIVHDAALELLASHLGSAAQLAGVHVLDVRERNMILAGLRSLQAPHTHREIDAIATEGGKLEALTPEEIDDLCERLNGI